jgi:sugar phosphate isomerase/epimerase
MNKDNVFISIIDENLADKVFTSKIDFNIELALFSLPHILDDPKVDAMVEKVKNVLDRYPIRRSMHGPVTDLYYDSRDKKVREFARERIRQGLAIAEKFEAEFMVAHSTFNPLQPSKKYAPTWLERSIEFWSEMAGYASEKGVTVVFENIFDASPTLLKEVITEVASPNFKACIDIGHLNIFSKVAIEEWIEVLNEKIVYIHAHNNYGTIDEHNGLADGTFDHATFFKSLQRYHLEPAVTLELRRIEDIEPSKRILATYW